MSPKNCPNKSKKGAKILRQHLLALTTSFLLLPASSSVFAATEFQGNLIGVSITDNLGTNTPPVAMFSYTQDSDTFTFDARESYDSDGNIVEYTWDFSDGTTGEGATNSYTNTAKNDFATTLTITDNDGGISLYHQAISLVSNFTDNFNRADGSLGSSWESLENKIIVIKANHARAMVAGNSFARILGNYSNTQYAQAVLNDSDADLTGVTCRMDANGNGYAAVAISSTKVALYKVTNWSLASNLSGSSTIPSIIGKTLKITCSGSTIEGAIDGIVFSTKTDTSYTTGTPGIMTYSTYKAGIDDFEGGDL